MSWLQLTAYLTMEETGKMKPKQQLLQDIGMPDAEETLKPILDNYAIGRWASVKERLPSGRKNLWSGAILSPKGKIDHGQWVISGLKEEPDYFWLELDLPGGEG